MPIETKSSIDEIMQDMSEIKDEPSYLSKNKIGSIVSLQKDSISQFSQIYTSLKTRQTSQFGQTNIRIVASLEKQLAVHEKTFHKFTLMFTEAYNILNIGKNDLILVSKEFALLESTLKNFQEKESDIDTILLKR